MKTITLNFEDDFSDEEIKEIEDSIENYFYHDYSYMEYSYKDNMWKRLYECECGEPLSKEEYNKNNGKCLECLEEDEEDEE